MAINPTDESDTVMEFVEEGQEESAKRIILDLGQQRFGPSNESIQAQINSITDLERLYRITHRLLGAANWQDLLDTP